LKNQFYLHARQGQNGYGLALLMIFLASTVLIGASLQLTVAPGSLAYLGSSSQNNLAAQELAEEGVGVVRADIQANLNSNQSVTTSYSYPVTSVNMPQDPTDLGGVSSTVGSYSATVTATRGDAFLVTVTATVGSASTTLSKLIYVNRNSYLLDSITGATAAYSVRKLRAAYAGSAIRVVRPSDSAVQDIGFAANGDLDIDSLKSFLGNTMPPLDSVSSAVAAYSLRLMRAAYTGSAIRVRRSSDNAEQDIGFVTGGDLDTASLMSFVGTSSGYVKTWYDQSGNGNDASQATTTAQPLIVSAGVLNILNGHSSLNFNGTAAYLTNSTVSVAGTTMSALAVANQTSSANTHSRLFSIWKNGQANDSGNTFSSEFEMDNTTGKLHIHRNNTGTGISTSSSTSFQASDVFDGTNGTIYLNGTASSSMGSTGNFGIDRFCIGWSPQQSSTELWSGNISEVILYSTALSSANRQSLERNQGYYYNLGADPWGYVSKWYDQSGNGKDVSQATTANQPYILIHDGLNSASVSSNGRPAVSFNGTQQLLSATGMPTNSDYTKSVVFSYYSNTNFNNLISSNGGHAIYNAGTNYFRMFHMPAGDFAISNTATSMNTPYAISATFTQSTMTGNLYQGNQLVGSNSTSSSVTNPDIYLGAWGNQSYLNGAISEAIVFSKALSSTDRTTVYNEQQSYFGAQ
jgi:hypothetical protein